MSIMRQHKVKCLYCGRQFDASREPFVKVTGSRYAHESCYYRTTNVNSDYTNLSDWLQNNFGQAMQIKIWQQIEDYIKYQKFTYAGILKTLKWWYEIKGNPIDKSNGGVGIIPYAYADAMAYYEKIEKAHELNKDKIIRPGKVRDIYIVAPYLPPKTPRLFNLDFNNEEETHGEK